MCGEYIQQIDAKVVVLTRQERSSANCDANFQDRNPRRALNTTADLDPRNADPEAVISGGGGSCGRSGSDPSPPILGWHCFHPAC